MKLMGEMKNACRVLVGKPERPLGTPRCCWIDIKMDLRMWWYGLELSDLGHGPVFYKMFGNF